MAKKALPISPTTNETSGPASRDEPAPAPAPAPAEEVNASAVAKAEDTDGIEVQNQEEDPTATAEDADKIEVQNEGEDLVAQAEDADKIEVQNEEETPKTWKRVGPWFIVKGVRMRIHFKGRENFFDQNGEPRTVTLPFDPNSNEVHHASDVVKLVKIEGAEGEGGEVQEIVIREGAEEKKCPFDNPHFHSVYFGMKLAERKVLLEWIRDYTHPRTKKEEAQHRALIRKPKRKKRGKKQRVNTFIPGYERIEYYDSNRVRPLHNLQLPPALIKHDVELLNKTFLEKRVLDEEDLDEIFEDASPEWDNPTPVENLPGARKVGRPRKNKTAASRKKQGGVSKRGRKPKATKTKKKKTERKKKDWHNKFEAHENRKGWLQCNHCHNAIWAPNARKHLRDCAGAKNADKDVEVEILKQS